MRLLGKCIQWLIQSNNRDLTRAKVLKCLSIYKCTLSRNNGNESVEIRRRSDRPASEETLRGDPRTASYITIPGMYVCV